jgi:hypothetical protein
MFRCAVLLPFWARYCNGDPPQSSWPDKESPDMRSAAYVLEDLSKRLVVDTTGMARVMSGPHGHGQRDHPQSSATGPRFQRRNDQCCRRIGGVCRVESLPTDGRTLASTEPIEVSADDALNPLESFFIDRVDTRRQLVRPGSDGASAPWAEGDDAVGFRRLDGDVHLAGDRSMPPDPVSATASHHGGMSTQLGEVPGPAVGFDPSLSDTSRLSWTRLGLPR